MEAVVVCVQVTQRGPMSRKESLVKVSHIINRLCSSCNKLPFAATFGQGARLKDRCPLPGTRPGGEGSIRWLFGCSVCKVDLIILSSVAEERQTSASKGFQAL